MKLSLCIATYNEEKFIHYPLDCAYDLADEVIIVDGRSTDKTVEIAKKYGDKVKVFLEDNPAMFHINKQKAIERAKGEWILQLDADEALSDDLKNEIKNIVEVNHRVAYWIPRKNFFLTRFLTKGGVYPDYTIRLYRNGVARFPCESVHENVEISTMKQFNNETISNQQSIIGYLKNPILHYADPDFFRYLKRWHRYNNLDVQILIKEKTKLSLVDYMIFKPLSTFLSMFFRHKGFMDGIPGLIFAFFSSLRFADIYLKWQRKLSKNLL